MYPIVVLQQAIVSKPEHITPLTEGPRDPPPLVCSLGMHVFK